MLLAVDIGNTQTHLGIFTAAGLEHEWRAATQPARTADELALLFEQFLDLSGISLTADVTGMALASVVPRATQEVREMCSRYLGFDAVVVEPGVRTGMAILTESPREVGADRIANAVAAHAMFRDEAVVVVDFGTAITVDAVSAKGEYLGGAIAPGIDISASALFRATAQIRRVALVAPPAAIGKNTVMAVQSGIIYGTAAMVDGLIAKVSSELADDPRVVATGGLAGVVAGHCERIERIEPILTLHGLRIIYERNAEEA